MTTYILVQPQNPPPEPQSSAPVPIAGGWILMILGILLVVYVYWYRSRIKR